MPPSVKFLTSRLALHLLLASFASAPAWSASTSPASPLSHAGATTLSVDVISGDISRSLVSGTPVLVEVEIAPVGFSFQGNLYAAASDPNNVFEKAVTVKDHSGTYTLALTTSSLLATGDYQKEVSIKLCTNTACTEFQPVKSISVPYQIDALSATSAWPGNHLTTLTAWSGVPDWTMFQGNAAHTGFVPVVLDPDKFTTRWQQAASYAVDLSTHLTVWSVPLVGKLSLSKNGVLYIQAANEISAFNVK